MRQLHPVSFHEKFVASGTYTIGWGGKATGDVEHWTLHEPGAGSLTIRSDWDGRAGSGASWLFEGFTVASSRHGMERFDYQLLNRTRSAIVSYLFDQETVQSLIRVDEMTAEIAPMPLPADAMVCPPSFVAAYWFVLRLLRQGRTEAAVLEVPVSDRNFASFSEVRIEPVGESMCEVAGASYPVSGYRLTVDGAVDGDCWFDRFGILMRYQKPRGQSVLLTTYVHRPEPTA